MRLELGHLNAVDGRPGISHLPDFFWRHLAEPQHPLPLQATTGEIDGTFVERLIQVMPLT